MFSLSLSWTCEIRREHSYLTVARGSHETLNLGFRGYTRLTPSLEVEILDEDNDIKMQRRLSGGAAVLTIGEIILTAGDTVLMIHAGGLTAGEIVLTGDETVCAADENRLTAHEIVLTADETIDAASETVVSRRTHGDSFDDAAHCRCEKRRQFSTTLAHAEPSFHRLAIDDDVHDIVIRRFVFDVNSAAVAADRSSGARLTNRIARRPSIQPRDIGLPSSRGRPQRPGATNSTEAWPSAARG